MYFCPILEPAFTQGFLQTSVSLMRQVMWVYKVKTDRQSDEVRGHLQGIKTNGGGIDEMLPGRGQVFDRGNNARKGQSSR